MGGGLRAVSSIFVTYSGVSSASPSLSFTTKELVVLKLQGSPSSPASPPLSVNFDVGSDSKVDLTRFNPLEQFDHIGKKRLHQVFFFLHLL